LAWTNTPLINWRYLLYLLQKNIEKKEEQGKIMGRKIETTKDDRKALSKLSATLM
jgi:hypothetical protein